MWSIKKTGKITWGRKEGYCWKIRWIRGAVRWINEHLTQSSNGSNQLITLGINIKVWKDNSRDATSRRWASRRTWDSSRVVSCNSITHERWYPGC